MKRRNDGCESVRKRVHQCVVLRGDLMHAGIVLLLALGFAQLEVGVALDSGSRPPAPAVAAMLPWLGDCSRTFGFLDCATPHHLVTPCGGCLHVSTITRLRGGTDLTPAALSVWRFWLSKSKQIPANPTDIDFRFNRQTALIKAQPRGHLSFRG